MPVACRSKARGSVYTVQDRCVRKKNSGVEEVSAVRIIRAFFAFCRGYTKGAADGKRERGAAAAEANRTSSAPKTPDSLHNGIDGASSGTRSYVSPVAHGESCWFCRKAESLDGVAAMVPIMKCRGDRGYCRGADFFGAASGALDGATAWFTPEIRDLGAAETAVVSTA